MHLALLKPGSVLRTSTPGIKRQLICIRYSPIQLYNITSQFHLTNLDSRHFWLQFFEPALHTFQSMVNRLQFYIQQTGNSL